ncbi:hypothetical protein HYV12_03710 [Candidatus Dojkabacteria bacterium]|nr:hypothetical protein [Candidatus Dojkabacteria bacterium]
MINWFVPNKGNSFKPYLLRNVALISYTLILLSVNTLGGVLGISKAQASSISKNNIIQLTNQERQKYGLTILRENAKLNSAALAKANNMFKEQYWDHFGPNGETPWQFIKASGYVYVFAGENLAKGFKSSEGVVQAWMASPTHRENILSGNYKDIGVAVLSGVLLDEEIILVVQMFGNTTSITTPSAPSNPNSVEEQVETGDIKSIKITYPVEGSVVNDPGFDLKGEVKNVTGDYTVDVYAQEKVVGKLSTNGGLWEFNRNSDWKEGDNKISAVLNSSDVKDEVAFEVDSTPPQIADEDIKVISGVGSWTIEIVTEEENPDIAVVVGSVTYPASFDADRYLVSIDSVEAGEKVVLVASDKHGNTLELEITDRFDTKEGAVLAGFLSNVNIKDSVNTLFVIFIFLLLLIEIVVYARKGMFKEHKGNLLSLSMWWLLLLVGTLNGFGGSIL